MKVNIYDSCSQERKRSDGVKVERVINLTVTRGLRNPKKNIKERERESLPLPLPAATIGSDFEFL